MSLSQLINVQISANTVLPTAAGFGVPAAVVYHTHNTDRIRYYTDLTGVTGDGHTVNGPTYKMVSKAFSQTPRPVKCAVIRKSNPPIQVLTLTCTSALAGEQYTATFVDSAGASHTLGVASTGVPATDGASVATAITAFTLAGCTVTHSGAAVTLTQTAGNPLDVQGLNVMSAAGSPLFTFLDTTADEGVASDLAAAYAADPTGWYGFSLDSMSKAECVAAVAFAEANGKIFAGNNSDTICGTSSTADIFSATQTTADARSYIQFSGSQLQSYAGMAILGNRLPVDPGSDTWAYKTLATVPTDVLSATQITNLTAKNANYYVAYKSVPITFPGVSPAGEYLDIVRGVDWLTDDIQTDVFALLVGSQKVPYTDFGVDQIVSVVKADLKAAIRVGFLDGGDETTPAPAVTAPTVASQSASNRAKRIFPGIAFSAKLAGAIHTLTINGVVSP